MRWNSLSPRDTYRARWWGFTGGTITGVEVLAPDTGYPAYEILNGSITAVVPTPLPDEGRH